MCVFNNTVFTGFRNGIIEVRIFAFAIIVLSFLLSLAFMKLLFKEPEKSVNNKMKSKSGEENNKNKEMESREERLTNYSNRTNDMRQMKNKQWLIVYYCSLIYAGIIGISFTIQEPKVYETNVLSNNNLIGALFLVIAIFVPIFGIYAICRNQNILKANRIETLKMEHNFHTGSEYHREKIPPLYVTYWFHWQYWLLFKVTILLGSLFSIVFLKKLFYLEKGLTDLINLLSPYSFYIFIGVFFIIAVILLTVVLHKKIAFEKYRQYLDFK